MSEFIDCEDFFEFENYEVQKNFEIWAFGQSPMQYSLATLHTWNSLHGDKLFLYSADLIQESLKKMYDLYILENHLEKK